MQTTRGRVIAKELRDWRGALGWSQSRAAAALRVPVRTLQGWEGGKPCVLPDAILALAEAVAAAERLTPAA